MITKRLRQTRLTRITRLHSVYTVYLDNSLNFMLFYYSEIKYYFIRTKKYTAVIEGRIFLERVNITEGELDQSTFRNIHCQIGMTEKETSYHNDGDREQDDKLQRQTIQAS